LEYGNFICENCATIHRQFGHTGIKGISVSNFSKQDVSILESAGNTVVQKSISFGFSYNKAFFPPDFQLKDKPNYDKSKGSKEQATQFIKSIYVDKKYSGNSKSDTFRVCFFSFKIKAREKIKHHQGSSYRTHKYSSHER
jgi:hypothetical protein